MPDSKFDNAVTHSSGTSNLSHSFILIAEKENLPLQKSVLYYEHVMNAHG